MYAHIIIIVERTDFSGISMSTFDRAQNIRMQFCKRSKLAAPWCVFINGYIVISVH